MENNEILLIKVFGSIIILLTLISSSLIINYSIMKNSRMKNNTLKKKVEILENENDSLRNKLDSVDTNIDNILNIKNKIKNMRPYIEDNEDLFDLAYSIDKLSEEYDINENLLISVSYIESSFRRYVKSHVGCVGYFQINPIAHNINEDLLYDTYFNVKMACEVLSNRMDRYQNIKLALNSYNGWASYKNVYANNVLKVYNKINNESRL